MQDNKQREKIDLSGGRALSVMALVPYMFGASTFAAPVWYLAVLPNIGFNAVEATAGEAAYVYDVPEVTTITVPRDELEDTAAAERLRAPGPVRNLSVAPLAPASIAVE
jgi:hypothetical protein